MLALLLGFCLSCGDDATEPSVSMDAQMEASESDAALELPTTFGGERPVELRVPEAYDAATSWPLIVFLHGYSSTSARMLRYSKLDQLVDEEGVLLLAPDGEKDTAGLQFWNATDYCCDFSGRNTDDVGYLIGLIDEVSLAYNVDPDRVYLWGHSNGGFMSYRLLCEHSDRFAAIVSFAGSTYVDASQCSPTSPVSVLHIHGTVDQVIAYDGSANNYPSAPTTIARFAQSSGCSDATQMAGTLDLTPSVEGEETVITAFANCPDGIEAQLWTVQNADHFPGIFDDFRQRMWSWYQAHPKRR